MGQRNSKSVGLLGKGGGGDDGCIGNRKVRTILLSILLIVFAACAQAYMFEYYNLFKDPNIATELACELFADDKGCNGGKNAWLCCIIGGFVVVISSILAILLFFVNAGDNVGRITGAGLITGGVLYIVGWLWWISIYKKYVHYDDLPDDAKDEVTFQLARWFGEALFPAGTAVLLGWDVFAHFLDNESNRLASNLSLLLVVSFLCGSCYYRNSDLGDEDSDGLVESNSFAWIATGYMILGVTSVTYIILYICSCCTCDCKDTKLMRLLHCVFLLIGGVLTCIGYYYFAGDVEGSFLYSTSDDAPTFVTYLIGYTVLVGGTCLSWALDIGLDDVRG